MDTRDKALMTYILFLFAEYLKDSDSMDLSAEIEVLIKDYVKETKRLRTL